jgi:hypothetical protein
MTSHTRQRADAVTLLGLTRQHGCNENRSHHVRDVTFTTGPSHVRGGRIPRSWLAAVRTAAIGLLRATGGDQHCRYLLPVLGGIQCTGIGSCQSHPGMAPIRRSAVGEDAAVVERSGDAPPAVRPQQIAEDIVQCRQGQPQRVGVFLGSRPAGASVPLPTRQHSTHAHQQDGPGRALAPPRAPVHRRFPCRVDSSRG